MKRILIIGGAGFIGFHLAKKLILNFHVDIIDNFSRAIKDKDFNKLLREKNVRLINLDLFIEDLKNRNI